MRHPSASQTASSGSGSLFLVPRLEGRELGRVECFVATEGLDEVRDREAELGEDELVAHHDVRRAVGDGLTSDVEEAHVRGVRLRRRSRKRDADVVHGSVHVRRGRE